jgi:hypothetical protein
MFMMLIMSVVVTADTGFGGGYDIYFGLYSSGNTTSTTLLSTYVGNWSDGMIAPSAPLNQCRASTTSDVLMLFFIAALIFGVLLLNILVLRLPILNLLPAVGLVLFGLSLFWCAWYLAFICWLLAVGVIVLSWGEL